MPPSPEVRPHRATLSDVAARAGVSVGTVQYVLGGRSKASRAGSAATREKVLRAAKALDYRPNRLARATRTGRSQTIMLSLTHLHDPWTAAMAEAVDSRARTRHLTTVVLPSLDWYEALANQEFDAALLTRVPASRAVAQQLRKVAGRGVDLVVLGPELEPEGFDVVVSDGAEGMGLATRQVLERRDIGCLTYFDPNDETSPNKDRLNAFRTVLGDAGLQVHEEWIVSPRARGVMAMRAIAELLADAGHRPSALVCDTAMGAEAALHAAVMLGIRVPDDLAIIGVGDLAPSQLVSPAVATAQHGDVFGFVSDLLVDRATGLGSAELHRPAWVVERRDTL